MHIVHWVVLAAETIQSKQLELHGRHAYTLLMYVCIEVEITEQSNIHTLLFIINGEKHWLHVVELLLELKIQLLHPVPQIIHVLLFVLRIVPLGHCDLHWPAINTAGDIQVIQL